MAWLIEHQRLISLLVNVGMLIVWIVYLQVFSAGFRRQRKATILITVGQDQGLDAHCLVTNMSAEPIYIHTVFATLRWPDGEATCPVTELGGERWSQPSDLHLWTRQGPLASAHIRDMGTLKGIVDHVRTSASAAGGPPTQAQWLTLEIRVVALYASEDLPVAASRRFDIVQADHGPDPRPHSYTAQQIRSRRERRQIAHALDPGKGAPLRRQDP